MATSYGAVAAEAVLQAGVIQKERYGKTIEVRHKGEIDLVTEVDKACEDVILATLRSRCPGHDIVTEETNLARTGSRYVWFVDPLDGTTNFAHGYPCFCSSVALAIDGEVVAGAVFDPLRQDLFTAERGGGAFLNGVRLRVSSVPTLIKSLLITGFPYDVHSKLDTYMRLFTRFMGQAQAVRRDGAAALDLANIAAGRIDGFWEERLHPWDILAGALMIEEAGGRVTRYDGSPLGVKGDEIVASNGAIHRAMLDVIAEDRAHEP